MPSIPVPSIPSTLPGVELITSPRRGIAQVVLVAPGAGPAPQATPGERVAVRPIDGSPLPDEWLPAAPLTGRPGEVHQVRAGRGVPRWLLGVGRALDGGPAEPKQWRIAGAALVRAVDSDIAARTEAGVRAPKSVQLGLPHEVTTECVAAFVLGVRLGGYRFTVSETSVPASTRSVLLVCQEDRVDAWRDAADKAGELAAATALARDLANTPSNVKNPDWLARTAERICSGIPGLTSVIRGGDWLRAQRFGGVLAVGGGSQSPPRLIELSYRPRGATQHLLLVGKGITFDTGGISIKPAAGMHLMRTDMSGGAAVIAAMRAIGGRKLPVRVTALVPAAENHVSGSAYRPGDVLRHYGGRTSEIGNTDAEGRIVLADALAYGVERFSPDVVVDVATLTGAMKIALGLRTGGLFASSEELAQRLCSAGARVGEAWWPMPLLDAHADALRSDIADVKQTPNGPGGITAALFLREFTDGLPWVHLDIAGPARAEKTYDEVTPGGTGFAARTLVEFAASYA
ncbi:MAG: leucyl aminopeptidase family protein [Pseudonocardiaceae bacterium]